MAADWTDPELLPPFGRGCWLCYLGKPEIRLSHPVCFGCFRRWFPSWSEDLIWDWLMRQAERMALRAAQEPEGRQLAFEGEL